MAKHYISKDDIMLGTEVEFGNNRCGEVADYLVTGVRLYYIVRPFDSYGELVLMKADDVKTYVWRSGD